MWDTLGWGGETQALIYNPKTKKVIGINALGVAPTGATAEFYKSKGCSYPPEYGPLAAVTPGTPGGLMTMLAEFGTLSLEGGARAGDPDGRRLPDRGAGSRTPSSAQKDEIKKWTYSRAGDAAAPRRRRREAPEAGRDLPQPDLAATLRKLVEAEQQALKRGQDRARRRSTPPTTASTKATSRRRSCAARRSRAACSRRRTSRTGRCKIEEPVKTTYKGIEVYKLTHWTQGPAMLQALNILENFDLKSMGYNSARYIHTVYQAMSLAFADRDFYYGDPDFPPEEPMRGLLSKEYAKAARRDDQPGAQRSEHQARRSVPVPGRQPTRSASCLRSGTPDARRARDATRRRSGTVRLVGAVARFGRGFRRAFYAGTTSIQAADAEGWVVSVTPSGGWIPAVIAGRTGIGLSQRAQSFVTDPAEGPFNVIEPGKRPRVTLTPTLALKDG